MRPFASFSSHLLLNSVFTGAEATSSQVAWGRELVEHVELSIIALPARQREVFMMRRPCGMSFEEIADRGSPQRRQNRKSTVRNRVGVSGALLPE